MSEDVNEDSSEDVGQQDMSEAQRADELQKKLGNLPELLAEVLSYVQSVTSLPDTWPGASPAGDFFALLQSAGQGQQQAAPPGVEGEALQWPGYEQPPLGEFETAPPAMPPELPEMPDPAPGQLPPPEAMILPEGGQVAAWPEFALPEPFPRPEDVAFEPPLSLPAAASDEAFGGSYQPPPAEESLDFPVAAPPAVGDFEWPDTGGREAAGAMAADGQDVFGGMPRFEPPAPFGGDFGGAGGERMVDPGDGMERAMGQQTPTPASGVGEGMMHRWGNIHVPDLDAEEGFAIGSPSVRTSSRAGMRGAGGSDFGSRYTNEPAGLSGQGGQGFSRGQLLDFTNR